MENTDQLTYCTLHEVLRVMTKCCHGGVFVSQYTRFHLTVAVAAQ